MLAGIEFSQGIGDAWTNITKFVPKLIGALAILIIGWIIAKIIRKVIHRVLTKLKFDDIVDKSGLGGHIEKAGWADSAALLATLLYYAVMVTVLKLAIGAFGSNDTQGVFDDIIAFIPKLVVALIIVVLTGAVANAVRSLVGPAVDQISYGNFIERVVVGVIWTVGIFAALDQIQVAEAIVASLSLILVIKFGVGGIWSARDRFWPAVYDKVAGANDEPETTNSN
jgi:hypothetical protein